MKLCIAGLMVQNVDYSYIPVWIEDVEMEVQKHAKGFGFDITIAIYAIEKAEGEIPFWSYLSMVIILLSYSSNPIY